LISFRQYLNMNVARDFYFCVSAAGVMVFLIYCLRISFFPTGMSLSDAIFFLMVIFSFSLLMGFFFIGWYSIASVLVWCGLKLSLFYFRLTKVKNNKVYKSLKRTYRTALKIKIFEAIFGLIGVSFIVGVVIVTLILKRKVQFELVITSILLFSLCIYLIINVNHDKRIPKENKKKMKAGLSIFMIVGFFVFSGMWIVLSDGSMKMIGVKKDNATFLLKEGDLEMARHLTGNQDQSFFYGDAIFTGVGDTSLLIINRKRLIVKNANLTISF